MESVLPNVIIGLVVGVISSIIAKYIIEGIKSLWFYRQYKSIGLEKVFANQEKAKNSIIKEAGKSKKLDVLAVKADSFSNPGQIFNVIAKNNNVEQRFLVSNPDNPYIEKRAVELKARNFAESIKLSITNLKTIKENDNPKLDYRLHEEVVRFRIILFDNYLYLSFQKINVMGKSSPILKIKKDSNMYDTYSAYFDDLWEKYSKKNASQSKATCFTEGY